MHLIAILLLSSIQVIVEVNSGPTNRARSIIKAVNSSNSYNSRRRDIHLDYGNVTPIYDSSNANNRDSELDQKYSETSIVPRAKVLLPDLDSAGRPHCLTTPDDTFCESVNNYPKTAVKQEVEYSPVEFLEIFGTKDIDGRKSYIDDDLSEERVCRRIPRVIYPKMAKNQANQWIYVVNEVEYTQAVVAEICEKEGKPCAYLDKNLPPGMFSRCRQKYSYKRLLALHPTEKRTYSDTFKFPSCCACYVKSNEILGRSLRAKKQSQSNK